MVLCNYFMNGNCRYGSKCLNDHIDLKTLLKNEAEAVINGKQWLLSCFGPFKESVVVPNFIPDQSFEEIRIAFMENSKNGNVQSYVNNLMTEYNNALRKMNEMKQPSSETLQLIASIYNTSNTSDQKSSTTQSQAQAPNPFQSSNIFGGSTQQQQTMPSSSIFGASTTQNNPFQQTNTQNPTSSIFGSSTTNNPVQSSAFSFNQTSQDQQKSSIFGQSSVFGSTQAQTSGGSVFSSAQTNIFAQQGTSVVQPPTQSVFGSTPAQPSVFGSTSVPQNTQSVFAALSAPQPTQNVFGGSTITQQPQQPAQSVFGSTVAAQPVQNIFGGSTVQSQAVPNVFGGSTASQPATQNIFAVQAAQQPGQNVFGGATTLQQPAQNVFATQAVQQPAQNVFGGFTQNQAQSQPFGQQSSVFGSTPQAQPQSDSMGGNIFNVQAPQAGQTSQIFSGNPFQQNLTINDEHFYSKDEDLTPEFIQAFQADSFIPGKIPILPPSKSLAYS